MSEEISTDEEIGQVRIVQRHASLFPGETASFPMSICKKLHADKIANLIVNDQIVPFDEIETEPALVVTSDETQGNQTGDDHSNLAVQLFIADGLSETVAKKLLDAGLDSPEKVRQHIAAGKSFESLTEKQAKSVLSLYAEPE